MKLKIATMGFALTMAFAGGASATTVFDYLDPTAVTSVVGEVSATDPSLSISTHNSFGTYIGQSFVAPSGLAESLTVLIPRTAAVPSQVDGVDFRVLISRLSAKGTPTDAVFESPIYTVGNALGISGTVVGPEAITIDLGGLDLVDGSNYAWIIDTASTADGIQGYTVIRSRSSAPGFDIAAAYDLTLGGLDRPWSLDDQFPLAYRMTFEDGGVSAPQETVVRSLDFQIVGAPTPEPSTWAMLLTGFLGIGWAQRRSARARA